MNDYPTCEEVGPELPELALGILTGRDRAAALAHVAGCARCTAELEQLSVLGDQLLQVAPDAEPPVGFESALFAQMGHPPTPAVPVPTARPAWRRPAWLAAAAVVVALAFAGGAVVEWSGRPGPAPSSAPAVVTADLVGARGPVGTVTSVGGSPGWLVMRIDSSAGSRQVACEVTVTGGRTLRLGTFWLSSGYGSWSARLPVPASEVHSARVVAASGAVIGRAVLNG